MSTLKYPAESWPEQTKLIILFYFFSHVSVSGLAICLLETLARACFTGKPGVHFKILCEESWKTDFKCLSLSSCARRSGASRGRVPVSCDLFV